MTDSRRGADSRARLLALETVYRTQAASFVRVARAIVGEEELAHDVVQEAFVRAIRSRDRAKDFTSPGPWCGGS